MSGWAWSGRRSRKLAVAGMGLLCLLAGCVTPPPPEEKMGIHDAARFGYINQVRVCLLDGVNVNARDAAGATPLHMAALGGWPEVALLLVDQGALVNIRDRLTGGTALVMAAMQGHADVVLLLLERGADVNLATNRGATALHTAAASGRRDIIRRLLEYGADPALRDQNGGTPADWAEKFGNVEVVQMLKADVLPPFTEE